VNPAINGRAVFVAFSGVVGAETLWKDRPKGNANPVRRDSGWGEAAAKPEVKR